MLQITPAMVFFIPSSLKDHCCIYLPQRRSSVAAVVKINWPSVNPLIFAAFVGQHEGSARSNAMQ